MRAGLPVGEKNENSGSLPPLNHGVAQHFYSGSENKITGPPSANCGGVSFCASFITFPYLSPESISQYHLSWFRVLTLKTVLLSLRMKELSSEKWEGAKTKWKSHFTPHFKMCIQCILKASNISHWSSDSFQLHGALNRDGAKSAANCVIQHIPVYHFFSHVLLGFNSI